MIDEAPREIRIRYADWRREMRVRKLAVNYSRFTRLHRALRKAAGDSPGWRRQKLTPRHARQIVLPFVGERAGDQLRALAPLALYLIAFQVLILHQSLADPWTVFGGLAATLVGLLLFMEGLRFGLMPLGEGIGYSLPRHRRLRVVLGVAFFLGVGVTLAEPAIGALEAAAASVERARAPYLRALLDEWVWALMLAVGGGVGIASVVGMTMFIRSWSLKVPATVATLLALGLTWLAAGDPYLAPVIGLAWDCGGVTTGPVTVTLVMALGIGTAAAAGKGENSLAGFGIVTLASLVPVTTVLGLALVLRQVVSPEELIGAAISGPATTADWLRESPLAEIVSALRAIVPLVAFLLWVGRLALHRVEDRQAMWLGFSLALAGMTLFNLGLTHGLGNIGAQAGQAAPGAFTALTHVAGSPLFHHQTGILVALIFALLLGFGATLAEPALNALGGTVETLSNGAFRKSWLIIAVSAGVAAGLALGLAKLIFALPLWWFLFPGYALALLMSWISDETFVNVAWDSAGVTTGPVTVPLVLAMGLGFGDAVGAQDGFGLLALASLGPILAVLGLGLAARLRRSLSDRADALVAQSEEA